MTLRHAQCQNVVARFFNHISTMKVLWISCLVFVGLLINMLEAQKLPVFPSDTSHPRITFLKVASISVPPERQTEVDSMMQSIEMQQVNFKKRTAEIFPMLKKVFDALQLKDTNAVLNLASDERLRWFGVYNFSIESRAENYRSIRKHVTPELVKAVEASIADTTASKPNFSDFITSMFKRFSEYTLFEEMNFVQSRVDQLGQESTADISKLRKLSDTLETHYIVSIPSFQFQNSPQGLQADLRFVFYDVREKQVVFDTLLHVGSKNRGFTYSCSEGTIMCPITNACAVVCPSICGYAAANLPIIKYKRELADRRSQVLLEKYYTKTCPASLKKFYPSEEQLRASTAVFAGLCNRDTSVIVFLACGLSTRGANSIGGKDPYQDRVVNFEMKDPLNIQEGTPDYYASIVVATKFKGKWYYAKEDATYFNASSLEEARQEYFCRLQGRDFFKDRSIEFNDGFWQRMSPVIQKPDSNDDSFMMRRLSRGLQYRDYEGYPKVVADQLIAHEDSTFKRHMDTLWSVACNNPSIFGDISKTHVAMHLISGSGEYSDDLLFAIRANDFKTPLQSTGFSVRYPGFLLHKTGGHYEVYEWELPGSLEDPEQNPTNLLKEVTDFEVDMHRISDLKFWQNYVFAKKDGQYLHLKLKGNLDLIFD